jgi:hypothetical protein
MLDHGLRDGNEHNAIVHIEIGMPLALLGVSPPDHDHGVF